MRFIVNIKNILFFAGLLILSSCGGGDGGGGTDTPVVPVVNLPGKASLSLPANGETCATFTAVATDNTKAEISFSWGAASYATSYVLVVTQGSTQVLSQTLTATSYKAVLDKGKTYSWTVTAKNKDGENASATNSFTTPGNPIGNYVPYAAIINFSINSSTSMASLSWIGKDEDSANSELKYNIEVKENNTVIKTLTNQTASSIADFTVVQNATYQIKITTIDKYSSASTSVMTYIYQ